MTRGRQWRFFLIGLVLMAIWFPLMPFRADEKHMLRDNFGLDLRDADGYPHDGMQEAFARVEAAGRTLHDIKNVVHEWVKARPKVAAKFLPFLAVCAGGIGAAIVWVC